MTTESVGPYLKQVRETQGLSLDQVGSLTRIQIKFLEALEEEDFADLPEEVFVRGFVRTYARSLGINEEDALRRFSEASKDYYEKSREEQRRALVKLEEERRGKFNRNVVIAISAILLGGLFLLLPRHQQSPPSTSSEETVVSESEPSEIPKPGELESGRSSEGEIQNPSVSESPPPEPTSPTVPSEGSPPQAQTLGARPTAESTRLTGDPLVLELEATQLTWVVVKSDDEEPHEALLQPGQRATWKANDQFTLTLGNAAGVAVRLNGESRGPFGKPGEVVRDVVLRN